MCDEKKRTDISFELRDTRDNSGNSGAGGAFNGTLGSHGADRENIAGINF